MRRALGFVAVAAVVAGVVAVTAGLVVALLQLSGSDSPAALSAPPAAIAAPRSLLPAVSVVDTSSQDATLPFTFAVIGDYGVDGPSEASVARLVSTWNPAFILALGDDYYAAAGGTGTGRYDASTGAYYGRWLKDITTTGTRLPAGKAPVNAFFPALGNHDYCDGGSTPVSYLTYFTLPGRGFLNSSGNERYYDFVKGPIHFFVLNSNTEEPDGTTADSVQARWLKARLAASTARYDVVYDHHPPFSSDTAHGSIAAMQWPFREWGADVVLSGHAHGYERVMHDGIAYLVNGLGGAPRRGFRGAVAGSAVRFSDDWGAQKVKVTGSAMVFEFYDAKGTLVDRYELPAKAGAASALR